jgi:hypothetical protein
MHDLEQFTQVQLIALRHHLFNSMLWMLVLSCQSLLLYHFKQSLFFYVFIRHLTLFETHFSLSNQPHIHCIMNTIDTQFPTCFGTSWVPSSGSPLSFEVVPFELVGNVRHGHSLTQSFNNTVTHWHSQSLTQSLTNTVSH